MLGVGASGPVGGLDVPVRSDAHPATPATSVSSRAPTIDERNAWAVLAGVNGLGPVGFGLLLARYGTGVAILREASSPGGPARLVAAVAEGAGEGGEETGTGSGRAVVTTAVAMAISEAAHRSGPTVRRIHELGLKIVTIEDPFYPLRLASIEMPPHVLFVLGDPAALDKRAAVAVVGTRRPTDAGRAIAAHLAATLVEVGATVVSGLAVGIDGAAHAAAVEAGGTTVAVLGSGHAVLYPRAHSRLAARIVGGGGAVVSELAPDVAPTQGTFPRRNRIVSGLADATVVVEAPAKSGALLTASWALEQGRECFIVPGPLGARASEGCLGFLREFHDSARIVAGIPQLIDDLGLADHLVEPGVSSRAAATLADVGEAAGRLGRELVLGRATVDELVAATGWPVASVLAGLTLLERRGLAVGIHGRFRAAGNLAAAGPAKLLRPHPRPRPGSA